MSNAVMNFSKGIIAGVVVGTTVGVVINNMSKPSKSLKKNAAKAMRVTGAMLENITQAFK